MKLKLRNKIITLIENIHFKIFGHSMGNTMKLFLGNLSWSFFGGIIASFLLLVVVIIAGRFMGPEYYGKYNLIVTYSSFLVIAIFLGMDNAGIRVISAGKTNAEKAKSISSFSVFIILNTIFISALLIVFRKLLLNHYSLDQTSFLLLLLFTAFFALKTMFDISIRGMKLFKLQSTGRIIEAVGVAIFFVIFFFTLKQQNYSYYIYSLVIGSGIVSIFYLLHLLPLLGNFDFQYLKKQFSYAKLFFINTALVTGLGSLDKIIIAKYLNVSKLGIYAAYYAASVSIISLLVKMFNNVLFPLAAGDRDKSFTKKLNKLIFFGFIPLLLLIMFLTFCIVKLYGNEYGIKLVYIVGFGILGTTNAISSVYNSIVISLSKTIYRKYVFYNNLLNIVNLLAYGIMIYLKIVSIELILIFIITNNIATIFLQRGLISTSIREYKKQIKLTSLADRVAAS
ncbi:MAG: oligosaccharide flippase family protein [Patescibacteria group bacterium]|nr:oligosaccharide flippase family protein [Patescibacteria group bacterium]